MKTIVVCFDVDRDFGLSERRTNVLKLYTALTRAEDQLPLYVPIPSSAENKGRSEAILKMLESVVKLEAVGAIFSLWGIFADSPEINSMKRYGLGNGVARHLQSAYELLLDHWEPGDRIAAFGNSHSAAVALLFADFVREFGLLPSEWKPNLPELIDRFFAQTMNGVEPSNAMFRSTFSRRSQVSFLGIWDCVRDLSFFRRGPARLGPQSLLASGTQVRHAISIDERRRFFAPLILSEVERQREDSHTKEVWFAGVHADVMGGYREQESGLSQLALAWMMEEAVLCGIQFDKERRDWILGRTKECREMSDWPTFVSPDPLGPMHRSLIGFWWEVELFPQKRSDGLKGWQIPLGQPRRIPAGALIHRSVCARMDSSCHYSPKNLPARFEVDPRR